jgi:hypothetical protein
MNGLSVMPKRKASDESVFGLLATIVVLAYLLPTLLCITKGQPNIKSLFFLNLLTGWTLIGWAVLLGYALLVEPRGRGQETAKGLLEEYALLTAKLKHK